MKYTIEEKKEVIKKVSISLVILHLIYAIFDIVFSENIKEIIPYLFLYGAQIIVNSIIAIQAKNFDKRKILIVLLGLINFFSGFIAFVVQIYLLIVELSTEKGKTPKPLPELEMKYPQKPFKYFIGFCLIYFIFYTSFLERFNINVNYNSWFSIFILYGLEVLALAIPFRKDLYQNFKALKGNISVYLKYALKIFGILFLSQLVINLILQAIIGEDATNETALEMLPLGVKAILAMIIAPFTEEILFRGFIRKIIKNDKLFIIVSGLVFGILHIWYVEENLLLYLYGIVYMAMGCILAKTYTKTNNIYASMTVHCFNNSLAILAEVLLKILENA